MPVLAIANQKGGVGKTTTAINLSSALAAKNLEVLLVDLDPQGNATTSLGFDRRTITLSVYEVLLEGAPLSSALLSTVQEHLFLLPSNDNLPGAEVELAGRDDRAVLLRAALEDVRKRFEYIIVDCPPSLGILTLNGLSAADGLVITMQAEFLALEGLSQLLRTVNLVKERLNPELQVIGVVLTMYDSRPRLTREVETALRQHFDVSARVLDTAIPRTVRLAEAPSHGLPINLYAPGSSGAIAYESLAVEVINATQASTRQRAGSPDSADSSRLPARIPSDGAIIPARGGTPGNDGTGGPAYRHSAEPEPAQEELSER